MTPASDNNGRAGGSEGTEGVLANLPRTRPQRSTARRSAARREALAAQSADAAAQAPPKARAKAKPRSAASARGASTSGTARKARATSAAAAKPAKGATAAGGRSAKGAKSTKPRAKTSTATHTPPMPRRPAPSAAEDQVPLQGFESEMDRTSGPVQPPGGTELVASAAELIGELARAGFSTGERLLRDALARLPLS
jgi:hypothetical protein